MPADFSEWPVFTSNFQITLFYCFCFWPIRGLYNPPERAGIWQGRHQWERQAVSGGNCRPSRPAVAAVCISSNLQADNVGDCFG